MESLQLELMTNGYTTIPHFFTAEECAFLLSQYQQAKDGHFTSVPLANEKSENTNTVYKSRSSRLNYCFLQSEETKNLIQKAHTRLIGITGMEWGNSVDSGALPLFEYPKGGFIKEHRDRDIGYGDNKYVCSVLLSEPGKDFTEGRFFLNECAQVSEDGRKVFSEDVSKRMYITQEIGTGIIFYNPRFIHGTEPVMPGTNSDTTRIVVSFRSS